VEQGCRVSKRNNCHPEPVEGWTLLNACRLAGSVYLVPAGTVSVVPKRAISEIEYSGHYYGTEDVYDEYSYYRIVITH